MFTKAIVRSLPRTIVGGITSANLGKPVYEKARDQHDRYVEALERCGLEVIVLAADEGLPDSVFVEDTAVVTDRCAVITRPGAESRRGEVREIEGVLSGLCEGVERIEGPGTLDGGDVLRVGDHFYVGLTRRTNREGAEQLAGILQRYGFGTSSVRLRRFLHLKAGVSYLGGNDLVVAGELAANGAFEGFDRIAVPRKRNTAPTASGSTTTSSSPWGTSGRGRGSSRGDTASSSWRCPSSGRSTAG